MTPREHISEANRRILELEREKQRIEEELKAWMQIRDGYAALAEKGTSQTQLVPEQIGFTEAIRVVLGKFPEGVAPTQIRDQLKEHGVTCGTEKNFMSNIHAILRRNPDIESLSVGGRKLYRLRAK